MCVSLKAQTFFTLDVIQQYRGCLCPRYSAPPASSSFIEATRARSWRPR